MGQEHHRPDSGYFRGRFPWTSPNSNQSIRRLRIASLWTFWLSIFAIIFFSPFNILVPSIFIRLNIDPTVWIVAAIVVTFIALAAIVFYWLALGLAQDQARDEFMAVLTGEAARPRPIILLLQPFDFAESGPVKRAAGQFLSGAGIVGFFFGVAGIAATAQSTPTRPVGFAMSAVEQELGAALLSAIRDATAELDDAIIDSQAMLVAIGDKCVSCKADKFSLKEKDGPEIFRRLAEAAVMIVMVPDMSPAVLWEFSQIVPSRDLLAKTVFIMPHGAGKRWAALAEYAASKLGATLPTYEDNGCFFRLTSDRRPGEAAFPEAFTRGLQNYLESQATVGTFSVAELWKSVESSQNNYLALEAEESSVLPQTASNWARRVRLTGFVEDGEALIKQLGGTVIYQEFGEIFTRETIIVRVFGEEHSFESKYDMVHWIIKEVIPRVPSGQAKPLSK